jgi:hypothetical protein
MVKKEITVLNILPPLDVNYEKFISCHSELLAGPN